MLNKCFFQGRLVKDPELRHTQSGTAVASFSLAVERDFKDKQTGEKVTDFIDCVAWRGTAEFVSRYFAKGSMAVVVGALQIRSWDDKDGNKRRTAEVVAESVYFGDSKRNEGQSGMSSSGAGASTFAQGYAPTPSAGTYGSQNASLDQFSDFSEDEPLPF